MQPTSIKILIVGIIISVFWISIFILSTKYPTNKINVFSNVSESECYEMGCSYQPKADEPDICVCLVK